MNNKYLKRVINSVVLVMLLAGIMLPTAATAEPKRDPSITIKPGAVFFTNGRTRFDQIFSFDAGNKTFKDLYPSWPTEAAQTGFAMDVHPTPSVLVNGKSSGYPVTVITGSWSELSIGTDRTSFVESDLRPVQGYAYGPSVTLQYGWYTSYGSGTEPGGEYPVYLWGLHSAAIPTDATLPIPDFASEAVQGAVNALNTYGWSVSYNLGLIDGIIRINESIKLIGDDPGDALRTIWEQGMERAWSNRYDIIDDLGHSYPMIFDVSFVDNNADQIVTVHSGIGRANMSNWYTIPLWTGRDGDTAAHELGHMLGVYDEYLVGPAIHL